MSTPTITTHPGPLPVAAGTGPTLSIVEHTEGVSAAVQCTVCHRVASRTGRMALHALVVTDEWWFAADPGRAGHVPCRRCPDCRAAGLHPEAVAA